MRKKISVIGEGVQVASTLARCAEVSEDLRGADVVVLAGDGDLEAIARSAPAAVVLVTGAGDASERCREVYEATLFPRTRVVGIDDTERLGEALEAVLFERDDELAVVAMHDGEFGPRVVRLGRGGIRALVHD